MKLKWGKEKVYKAERDNEISWWALFAILVVMIAIFICKDCKGDINV